MTSVVSSSGPWTAPSQIELFGVAAAADARATTCPPCPQCGSTVGTIGPGGGPHYARLTCVRGHFLKWLPKA